MSYVRIAGRNISRTWLNRPEVIAEREHARMIFVLCVTLLLWDHIQIQTVLDELVAERRVRELPDGRYEAI